VTASTRTCREAGAAIKTGIGVKGNTKDTSLAPHLFEY